jgi:hypothetical protein
MQPSRRTLLLLASHGAVAVGAFAAGIYTLPILTASAPPAANELDAVFAAARFRARFERKLAGSDALHWGEGDVALSDRAIALRGRLAPGPDYRLYLVPEFVDTEAAFEAIKPGALQLGMVRRFENFVVPLPPGTDLAAHTTVLVWCETFREFITAARYR